MNRFLALFLFLPFLGFGQVEYADFPKDTSFNVQSAARKIAKDFPQAQTVKETTNLQIRNKRNVVYYSLGKRDLHADLFYPTTKKKKKIPAVILIHGGGWASGNKSHLIPMAQKLAANGFFATTVEHRLSPEAKYPAAIIDLKTAVKWVKSNAKKYNIDTTKIAVLGCSAGATLASFLAVTGQSSKFTSHQWKGKESDMIQALINIDGIVDFTDPAESGKDSDPQKPSAGTRWFGSTFSQNPDLWIEASPLSWVDKNTPPTLFVNSALPRFHAGRDEFTSVLSSNTIYFEIHTIEKTPHPFWLFHPWFDETVPKIVDFLQQVF